MPYMRPRAMLWMTRRDHGKIIVIIETVKYLMKSLEIIVKKLSYQGRKCWEEV